MTGLVADLRCSWRIFRHSPGLALVAIAALAMGVGFTTTMFSIVHGATRELPLADPEELVAFAESIPRIGANDMGSPPSSFRHWIATLTSVEALGAYRSFAVNISRDRAHPDRLEAAEVTPDTFALLGIGTSRGRLFTQADTELGAPDVVLVSHALWQSRFGGDEGILGRTIWIDGQPRTVIGIMPPRFGFPINSRIWLPLRIGQAESPVEADEVRVFGRLADGVSVEAAQGELEAAMAGLAAIAPEVYRDRRARVFPFTELETPPEIRRALRLLVAVVSIVLLVACANVANLLMARAAARAREIAVRTALGASRARLVTQQLAESALLAGAAAIAGLIVAHAGLKFFEAASRDILTAFWVDLRLDATVVAFATLLGLGAAVAAGLVPAIRASAAGAARLMKESTGSSSGLRMGRFSRWLVVGQLALACGLLVVTVTFARASAELRAVDIPFPAGQILTAQLSVRQDVLASGVERNRLFRGLREALAASPDFPVSALVSVFPGRGAGRWTFTLPDTPMADQNLTTGVVIATPELFDLAKARPMSGRLFGWQDDERAPLVAVANQSFVRRFLPGVDPLDQRVRIGGRDVMIVGVVRDLLVQDVEDLDGSGLYLPLLQSRPYTVRVMAHTIGAPMSLVPTLRRTVAGVDPDLPLLEFATLFDAIYADKRVLDALAALFMCFGAGAVFLALIGLYAVVSFAVTERTREFGVRMALGATGRDIVGLVLKRGAGELACGLSLGLVLAFALSRVLGAAIERLPPAGPLSFGLIAATVLAGALFALWRPLRRTLRVEPAQALRTH